jgi:hypothetical protein
MDDDGDEDGGGWMEEQRKEEEVMLEGSRFYQVAVYDRQTSQRSLRGGWNFQQSSSVPNELLD